MNKTPLICTALALSAFVVTRAFADEITLKNGDRITGDIQSAADGKLVLAPSFAADTTITVAIADIATFSSEKPITLVLGDGTVIRQSIGTAQPGAVTTKEGGSLVPQRVALDSIAKINPPPVTWTGNVAANALYAQSNTRTLQFGASADASRRSETDRISFGGAYQYGEQKVGNVSSTTTNTWFAQSEYDAFLTPKFFAYGSGRIEQDHVNYLKLRLLPGAGVGYQWFESPEFNFALKGGLAWLYEDYSNFGGSNDSVNLNLSWHIDRSFNDGRIKLFNDVSLYPSVQNSKDFLALVSGGMRLALTKTMFSQISVNLNYDNNPAPGARQTTTQYLFGLGFTF